MTKEIETTDEELEALMAELEEQNAQIAAAQAAKEQPKQVTLPVVEEPAAPTSATEPAVASAPEKAIEATPEPVAAESEAAPPNEPASTAVAQPEPEPTPAAQSRPVEIPVGAVKSLETNGTSLDGTTAATTAASEKVMAGLQHYVDVDQFRSDTRVTEATLDTCMIEQAGLRAYYGAVAARAEAQAARVKAKFEVAEATLYDHHRKALALTGEKTTEKMVENAVKLDSRWIKAKNLLIEAETIASINKSLVESLKDRRDMIIQLGADRRDEYKGAARILAEQNEREELRDRAMRLARTQRAG